MAAVLEKLRELSVLGSESELRRYFNQSAAGGEGERRLTRCRGRDLTGADSGRLAFG